jgi:hypothetical protein
MKFIKFSIALILIISIVATANAQKSERAYVKNNTTFGFGIGGLSTDALLISTHNNFEGLQGDYQPSSLGPIYLNLETHLKDNYIFGVTYSYVSAKSGAGLDDYLRLYQHTYSAHQLTAKYALGWYNAESFGGMFYSAIHYGLKFSKEETEYPDYILVTDPEIYPYKVSDNASHLTIIGYKGTFIPGSPLGVDLQVGVGALGIISGGINYTIGK